MADQTQFLLSDHMLDFLINLPLDFDQQIFGLISHLSSGQISINQILRKLVHLRNEVLRFGTGTFFHRTDRWFRLGGSEFFLLAKKEGDEMRSRFLQESNLPSPSYLRIIDVRASIQERMAVLIPWDTCKADTYKGGYAAISHTYGMEVYDVYNCPCASICRDDVKPRAPSTASCNGHAGDGGVHEKVTKDILGMCQNLVDGGVEYAWHDGVCIAQHDEEEVKYFIQHMGWIYSSAVETIVFLHYIGKPMFPIGPGSDHHDLISRWQTRAWTFQEAVLSRCRRYFVPLEYRSLRGIIRSAPTFSDVQSRFTSWLENHPASIKQGCIIDESQFWRLINNLYDGVSHQPVPEGFSVNNLRGESKKLVKWVIQTGTSMDDTIMANGLQWTQCLCAWMDLLQSSLISFPNSARVAMETTSRRDSKHEGDRINSILALVGVKEFVADKDEDLEKHTMEFFQRMGHRGLAIALFSTNVFIKEPAGKWAHTWVPTLSNPLHIPECFGGSEAEGSDSCNNIFEKVVFEVLGNGNIELTGSLTCVHAHFLIGSAPGNRDSIGGQGTQLDMEVQVDGKFPTSIAGDRDDIVGNALLSGHPLDLEGVPLDATRDHLLKIMETLYGTSSVTVEISMVMPVVLKSVVSHREAHFHCSMVFPKHILTGDPDSYNTFPVLLVQAVDDSDGAYISDSYPLHAAPVAKVGSFIGNKRLIHHIRQNPRVITSTLESLIIM